MYYFYHEWTFKDIPEGLDSAGPYHSRVTTMEQNLLIDWKRMQKVVVISFDTKEELDTYWESKQ